MSELMNAEVAEGAQRAQRIGTGVAQASPATPPIVVRRSRAKLAQARSSPLRPSALPLRSLRSKRSGFTIIEVIVIVVILGVIAAVIAPRLISRIGQSKQALAESNAASLATAMKTFQIDHYAPRPGDTIDILWERPSDVAEGEWEPYVDNADALLDPWGRKFALVVPGDRNVDFDIVSYGADGSPGGEGENADIVKP